MTVLHFARYIFVLLLLVFALVCALAAVVRRPEQ